MTEGQPHGELLLYQTEHAQTRIQVRSRNDRSVLTTRQPADLFQSTSPSMIPRKVAADFAQAKHETTYTLSQQLQKSLTSTVEHEFEAAMAQPIKRIEKSRKPARLPTQKKGTNA